jgi:hypothetical protein
MSVIVSFEPGGPAANGAEPPIPSRLGRDVAGLAARSPSPVEAARAPVPYFSPVLRFDSVDQELIVEFRNASTGEIEKKYPSGWLAQAYSLTGLVEAKGPVAVAQESGKGAQGGATDPAWPRNAAAGLSISLSI